MKLKMKKKNREDSDFGHFRSSVTSSGLNHCPKSRSKLRSPSGRNMVAGSNSSSDEATEWIKSLENRFEVRESVAEEADWFIEVGLLRIAEGDGAVMLWLEPGTGVGG